MADDERLARLETAVGELKDMLSTLSKVIERRFDAVGVEHGRQFDAIDAELRLIADAFTELKGEIRQMNVRIRS